MSQSIKNLDYIKIEDNIVPPELTRHLFEEKDGKSYTNLISLFKDYSENKTVAFIGAGMSIPLDIPGWKDLMERLLDKCSTRFKNKYKKKLGLGPKAYPELADDIFKSLKRRQKAAEFYDEIRQMMDPQVISHTQTHEKIVATTNIQLTTNFDSAIDQTYKHFRDLGDRIADEKLKISPNVFSIYNNEIERPPDSSKGNIYYLHADMQSDFYILRKCDYNRYYPNVSKKKAGSQNCIIHCLRTFYQFNNIVFIGFSFDDNYVKECFYAIAKQVQLEYEESQNRYDIACRPGPRKNQIRHYLLVSENTAKDWLQKNSISIFKEFEPLNIYPIIYSKNRHLFIYDLFNKLDRARG